MPATWLDEETIVVAADESGLSSYDIWELPLGAPAEIKPIVETRFDEGNTTMLSPDGNWMAYVSNRSGAYEVWVQRYPDGPPSPLTSGGAKEPVWSRDGKTGSVPPWVEICVRVSSVGKGCT